MLLHCNAGSSYAPVSWTYGQRGQNCKYLSSCAFTFLFRERFSYVQSKRMSIFVIIGNYHCFKRTYLKLSPTSLQNVSGRVSELLIGKKPETRPLSGGTRIFTGCFRVTIAANNDWLIIKCRIANDWTLEQNLLRLLARAFPRLASATQWWIQGRIWGAATPVELHFLFFFILPKILIKIVFFLQSCITSTVQLLVKLWKDNEHKKSPRFYIMPSQRSQVTGMLQVAF